MHEFQPQELSNLLWAMATLTAVPPASLLQRLYDASEPLLPSFTVSAGMRVGRVCEGRSRR